MSEKLNLDELLYKIVENFDKICYRDKEKGLYDGKAVEELYGVTEEELQRIFAIFPRERVKRLARKEPVIDDEGAIEIISNGGFKYRFSASLWQYEKTSQIIKRLWIKRNVILDESDDTQYTTLQDSQKWLPNYDEKTNTEWKVMFEYEVKLEDVKITAANKLIPLILDNLEMAKRVGSMPSWQFPRDDIFNFYLVALNMFRLMERDKKRNEIITSFTQSSYKYVEKWTGEFNITYDGVEWLFFAVHELDGDPHFDDYKEHLQAKCHEKEIDMIIYSKIYRGN